MKLDYRGVAGISPHMYEKHSQKKKKKKKQKQKQKQNKQTKKKKKKTYYFQFFISGVDDEGSE